MTNDNYEHICDNTQAKETSAKSQTSNLILNKWSWHFSANEKALDTCLNQSEARI